MTSGKREQKLLVYIVALIVLIFGFALRYLWQKPSVFLPKNQNLTFVAIVKSEPKISKDRQVITIGDSKIYTSLFPKYQVGDRIKVEGRNNENGFIFNPQIKLVGHVSGVMYQVAAIRTKISDKVYAMLPEREATLVVGSVLGVDNISEDFRQELISTGTIHVVVVSGQNLAIVAGLFVGMAKFIGRRKSLLLACVAVFLYALLAGFNAPVLRAVLMVLASAIAVLFGREVNALWSLVLAALLIVFVWPAAILETSFQLTFAASLGIMTLGQKLQKIINHKSSIINLFWENAAVSTSAYLFTAPIIFWHFGRLTLIAPIANIFVAEAVFSIMFFGFLTAIFSLIFTPIAQVFAWFAYVPALYFVSAVQIFSSIG
ncbi:MAG TPA: ComEC/Rec2 family competence protein [Candidatus Saccharimonadales bacterium]|nr:ComEC/Rec2 family competence protein [Candidatus Saccharimonadales bacterium]